MQYLREQAAVVYHSKDGKVHKTYLPAATGAQAGDAPQWIATIPACA